MISRCRRLFPEIGEFTECPEFDFSPCWWRFEEFEARNDIYGSNANYTHGHFDAHAKSFANGLAALLASDTVADELRYSSHPRRKPHIAQRHTTAEHARIPVSHERRDVFICHASEDKELIVEPLCTAMDAAAITYWLDKVEIKWGDSVTSMVNRGLGVSDYVVVVLSTRFLGKPWPERELNAALNVESSTGQVKVLPLVVGTDSEVTDILNAYPLLNDKSHIRWSGDPDAVTDMLKARLGRN